MTLSSIDNFALEAALRRARDGGPGPAPQGQPRAADAAVQARIARKTQQKPSDGSTHWSCRKMAKTLGLTKSTVQRVWRKRD